MDLFLVDDNNPGLYRTILGRHGYKTDLFHCAHFVLFYAQQSDTKWMNEYK